MLENDLVGVGVGPTNLSLASLIQTARVSGLAHLQALVAGIRDNSKQLLNTLASHRGYGPELGHVGADSIDHRGLLADEELARAMEH